MDTQPLDREPAPPAAPAGEKPRRSWCSFDKGDTGVWVALWVAIFVPMMSTISVADEPADLLWTALIIGVVLAIGAGMYRLFKNRV